MSRHFLRKQLFYLLFRKEFFDVAELGEQEKLFFLQDDIEDRYEGTDIWDEEEETEEEERMDEAAKEEIPTSPTYFRISMLTTIQRNISTKWDSAPE